MRSSTQEPILHFFELAMDRRIPVMVPSSEIWSGHDINLGHGEKEMPEGVESIGLPEWDAEVDRFPLGDETVGRIWALHFLEHIWNIGWVMSECQRILKPGGVMNIMVPYGTCHMAVQDPDHKRWFNEDTWRHMFANPYYTPNRHQPVDWRWTIGLNMIMGLKGENLALLTQLIKSEK